MVNANSTRSLRPKKLPLYITERDAVATAAGLSITHEFNPDASQSLDLSTTWAGTEAQFRATGLFLERFKFRNDHNLHVGYIRFAEMSAQDERIILSWRNRLPLRCEPHHQYANIEVLDHGDCAGPWSAGEKEYHGTAEDLIAAGIVPITALPGAGAKRMLFRKQIYVTLGGKRLSCDTLRQPSGKFLVCASVVRYQDYAPATPAPWSGSPAEWLEMKEDMLCSIARLLAKHNSIETAAHERYTVDAAALQSLCDEIELIAQRLRNLDVKVSRVQTESEPAGREKVLQASTDTAFQSFVRGLLPRQTDES